MDDEKLKKAAAAMVKLHAKKRAGERETTPTDPDANYVEGFQDGFAMGMEAGAVGAGMTPEDAKESMAGYRRPTSPPD